MILMSECAERPVFPSPLLSSLLTADGGQSMVEDKFLEMQAAKESPDIPEVDEDGKPLTKKARTALMRAAEKEREKRLSSASDRIEPQVTSRKMVYDIT